MEKKAEKREWNQEDIPGLIPSDFAEPKPLPVVKGHWNQFYVRRLLDLMESRHEIDTGMYKLRNYEGVNVYPDNYSKGLRHGILRGIAGTYSILCKRGLKEVADTLVEHDRQRQGI